MSKKKTEKKATAKKVPESKAKANTERPEAKKTAKGKELPPTAATIPTKDVPTTPTAPPTPDPRLPATGTLLQKRDRHGSVRCECTVEEGGVRYAGKVYRSLSSAAMAAAKDLGLTNKTQNGFVFWGLSRPPRHTANPLEVLGRAWDRYRERAASVAGAANDENREQIRKVIAKHVETIANLQEKVA